MFHSVQVWETLCQKYLRKSVVAQGGSWPEGVVEEKCNSYKSKNVACVISFPVHRHSKNKNVLKGLE